MALCLSKSSQSLIREDDVLTTYICSFNSVAIEAQLRWLPASTFLYLNDDFYVSKELAPADIASLLLGPTFRLTRTRHPTEQEFAASSRNLHKRNREIYAVNSWSLLGESTRSFRAV